MYIIDRGTANHRNIQAYWKITTTNAEKFPAGELLQVELFIRTPQGIEKEAGVLEVDNFIHGNGLATLATETEGHLISFEIGNLCCVRPSTWAHIAIDLIDNIG